MCTFNDCAACTAQLRAAHKRACRPRLPMKPQQRASITITLRIVVCKQRAGLSYVVANSRHVATLHALLLVPAVPIPRNLSDHLSKPGRESSSDRDSLVAPYISIRLHTRGRDDLCVMLAVKSDVTRLLSSFVHDSSDADVTYAESCDSDLARAHSASLWSVFQSCAIGRHGQGRQIRLQIPPSRPHSGHLHSGEAKRGQAGSSAPRDVLIQRAATRVYTRQHHRAQRAGAAHTA